jgi:hypothetical protein
MKLMRPWWPFTISTTDSESAQKRSSRWNFISSPQVLSEGKNKLMIDSSNFFRMTIMIQCFRSPTHRSTKETANDPVIRFELVSAPDGQQSLFSHPIRFASLLLATDAMRVQ